MSVIIFYSFLFLRSKIDPSEVMISLRPSLSVILHCLFVFSQIILSQFELFFSLINLRNILLSGGLESLFRSEFILELHPVLSGIIE